MHFWRALASGVLLAAWLTACGDPAADTEPAAEVPLLAFDSTRVRLVSGTDTLTLRVEVADDEERRALGLMERTRLDPDAGMLFTYDEPQPAESGFWMFHTRIPLDIAFLDEQDRIVAIRTMEPCESPDPRWCPTYSPGVPYQSALEVNRGYFQQHGIEVGDRLLRGHASPAAPSP